jgi:hypothetical protein
MYMPEVTFTFILDRSNCCSLQEAELERIEANTTQLCYNEDHVSAVNTVSLPYFINSKECIFKPFLSSHLQVFVHKNM